MEKTLLQDFYSLTGKNTQDFFSKCLAFFQNDYTTIVYYYSGRVKSITSKPFKVFEELSLECQEILEVFQENSFKMSSSKWWEMLEYLEDIDSQFQTLRKINKWSRSSSMTVGYSPTAQISYPLLQNQTLERVSQDILSSSNPQDDWINIALENQLTEEDYTREGGNLLKLNFNRTINTGIVINSVVDSLVGKSIYGKDLDRRLTIQDDDLIVLDYDQTIFQAVDILSKLKKNDHPDYPTLGLRTSVAVGGNRAALNFPIIDRQMSATFLSDDTLKGFRINSIKVDQDNLLVEFQVKTRLDEIQSREIIL